MSKEKIRPNPAILGTDLKSVSLLIKDDKEKAWSLKHKAKVFTRTFWKYVPPKNQLILTSLMALFVRQD